MNLLSEGARQLALGGLPERSGRFAACTDFLALLQGNGSSDRFYTFDTQGSVNGILSGGLIVSPHFQPWGNGNLGDTSGSPFGYKGQSGAYTDQESQQIILVGHAPYVPAAPTYVAPNALHDDNPYQGGANEEAPDAWVGVPKSQRDLYKPVLDAAHQVAGGLGTALQTAADFNILCIINEILTGQDASGHCVSKERRFFDLGTLAAGPIINVAAKGVPRVVKTLRTLLSPEEVKEFEQLTKELPAYMPELDSAARYVPSDEFKKIRNSISERGHHKHPISLGEDAKPEGGLLQTGDTRRYENPDHARVSGFWRRVYNRLKGKK